MRSSLRELCSLRLVAAFLAGIFCLAGVRTYGQYHPNTVGGLPIPDPAAVPSPDSQVAAPFPQDLMERARKAFNEERHQKVTADTEKLVKLTHELQAEVSKTDEATFSEDVVKKVEAIEKLAHRVEGTVRKQ
jgi:hypothetical protein